MLPSLGRGCAESSRSLKFTVHKHPFQLAAYLRPQYSIARRMSSTSNLDSGLPSVATSRFMRNDSKLALKTPAIKWTDNDATRDTRHMNMYQALRDAMSTALAEDDTAIVLGEDVAFGGVFRCTMGLAEEFGRDRVINTPITEQGIAGFSIGLASMGQTTIAEIQFADYIYPAFDQIVNEAAKMRYRSGGEFAASSLTIRAPCMAVGHGGLYHSQSPEGFFMGAAGLKIVIPRSPIQAKGLLLASIRDPNPVVFFEPKTLYRAASEHVPVSSYSLPLSSAEILQPGEDLTIVSWGSPLYTIETALAMISSPPPSLEKHIPEDVRKAKIELIDLRTILPWDKDTIVQSVNKTGRLLIVHEAGQTGGVGSDIASIVAEQCFLKLEAPVQRVCGWDAPSAPLAFEKFFIPDALRVADGIVSILRY